MRCSKLAVRAHIGIGASPFVVDTCLQYMPNGTIKPFHVQDGKAMCLSQGMDLGAEESLISVHIAYASNDFLVAENGFYG